MRLLEEGQIVRGTYEVECQLGSGAFGEVYRVKHLFLKRRQAMKIFKDTGMSLADAEEKLEEAKLLSEIEHPNIIRVFDAGTTPTAIGECGFFTMEYVAGGSLQKFWSSYGAVFMPVETAVQIALQVARGLVVAHQEKPPIVHRDIKPQNILVGYDANGLRVRISDFGLAKRVNHLTLLASARGTVDFKAPEVWESDSDSCAGDIWAAGTTLYLLLTDRFPYPNMRDTLAAGEALSPDFPPPSSINFQVNGALDSIIKRCLALKREQRPTASELVAELQNWRPSAPQGDAKQLPGESSLGKLALGTPVSHNHTKAEEMAARAADLSRDISKLREAADLMEEAFNYWPALRDRYDYKMKLWRRGVAM